MGQPWSLPLPYTVIQVAVCWLAGITIFPSPYIHHPSWGGRPHPTPIPTRLRLLSTPSFQTWRCPWMVTFLMLLSLLCAFIIVGQPCNSLIICRVQLGQATSRLVKNYIVKRWWGGSGIGWTICKSFAPHSRLITMPALRHSIFLQTSCSSWYLSSSVKALGSNLLLYYFSFYA